MHTHIQIYRYIYIHMLITFDFGLCPCDFADWCRISGGYPAMSIGLLVFASVSGGTAWIVDSLFNCNLETWTISMHCNLKNAEWLGASPELSVEKSLFWSSLGLTTGADFSILIGTLGPYEIKIHALFWGPFCGNSSIEQGQTPRPFAQDNLMSLKPLARTRAGGCSRVLEESQGHPLWG